MESKFQNVDSFLNYAEELLKKEIVLSKLTEEQKFNIELITIPSIRGKVSEILDKYGIWNDQEKDDLTTMILLEFSLDKICKEIEEAVKREIISEQLLKVRKTMREEIEKLTLEQLREAIKKDYTVEKFVNLISRKQAEIENGGLKLNAISTKFGVKGNPNKKEVYIELAKKIYGEEEVEKVLFQLEKLREKIQADYTVEEFINLTGEERKEIEYGGIKLRAISTKFGVEGNPVNKKEDHIELAKKIYGEEEVERVLLQELEELRKLIKKDYTVEKFVNLTKEKRKNIEYGGLKLYAISTKFGINGNPIITEVYIELAKEIYGEEEVERVLFQELEELRKMIKKDYTVEEFVNLTEKKRRKIKCRGLQLCAIATKFEVEGKPNKKEVYIELAKKIYGEEEVERVLLQELEELRKMIKKDYTVEEFVNLTSKEREKIKYGGLKLTAIARKFGVEGDPIGYKAVHIELAKKIYGEKEVEKFLKTKKP